MPAAKGRNAMRYLHTMVRVKDLDESLDFYCNKLGLVEQRRARAGRAVGLHGEHGRVVARTR